MIYKKKNTTFQNKTDIFSLIQQYFHLANVEKMKKKTIQREEQTMKNAIFK